MAQAEQPAARGTRGRSTRSAASLPSARGARLHRMAAMCCRAVVRAQSESALARSLARLLVQGGYAESIVFSVRVDFLEPEIAAHAGALVARRSVEEAASNPLRDAVMRALHQGTPMVEAVGQGRACVVPLIHRERRLGAILVRDDDAAVFSSEETAILSELAADVSHGLAALRDRVRQRTLASRLKAAEERYAGIFENAREGIFAATRSGRIKLVNPAFARLVGYSTPAEYLASPYADLARLLEEGQAERLLAVLEAKGATEPPLELVLRHRMGRAVWVSMNAQIVAGPGTAWIEGFVQDQTLLQEEREANRELAAIVEASEEAIFSKDLEGTIQTWNRGAEALYGFTSDEAIGRVATDLIIPEDRIEEEHAILETIRRGRRVPLYETKRLRRDGSLIDVALAASPMHDGEGRVIGLAMTAHDITRRKRHESTQRALERQRAEVRKLEDVDRLRTSFINEAAHELKTPLTPILTHIELLLSRDDLEPAMRRSLQVLERNASRMSALVKDMLDVSRMEVDRPPLVLHETELGGLLRDTVESFAESAQQAGVTVKVEAEGEIVAVVDRARITQVLFNLLQNAIKFSSSGGRVVLSGHDEGEHVHVSVRDFGRGLEPAHLPQLFQPFQMLHDPTKGPAGTGLGLFISKRIVERHGGRIWAESEGAGKGLAVHFTVPKAPQPPMEEPAAPKP